VLLPLIPAGINRAGSRGGNASVMVATESFERVSALAGCVLGIVAVRDDDGAYRRACYRS
jgi:hypothetical protein